MFSKQSLYVCGLKYDEINQTKCWCLKAVVRITSEAIMYFRVIQPFLVCGTIIYILNKYCDYFRTFPHTIDYYYF